MQLDSVFQTLVAELIKLAVTGIIAGYVGSRIGIRQFQSQTRFLTKYQDNFRRREALRDILLILDLIFGHVHRGWDDPIAQEDISPLNEKITRTQTLFLDDAEITTTLTNLRLLIGTNFEDLLKSGRKLPSETIGEVKKLLETRINEITKSLY